MTNPDLTFGEVGDGLSNLAFANKAPIPYFGDGDGLRKNASSKNLVSYVQGGGANGGFYGNGSAGQVLAANATVGDSVVLFLYDGFGAVISAVSSGMGAVFPVAGTAGQVYVIPKVTVAGQTAIATGSGGGWRSASALEFGPAQNWGAAPGGAVLNGGLPIGTAKTITSTGLGANATATVENITPGSALIVFCYDTGGVNGIQNVPGAPWSSSVVAGSLILTTGNGSAWLTATTDADIGVSFPVVNGDPWSMTVIELLPAAV